jgi:hypothetical protein
MNQHASIAPRTATTALSADRDVFVRSLPVRWRDLLIGGALFALAFWHVMGAAATRPFHRDEARWVHRASYLAALADPLGPLWIEEGRYPGSSLDERFPLRAQPPLGGYVMGLGLLLQGRDLETNGFWNMDRDDAWNEAHGNMPEAADLTAARRTAAAVATLTVVVVYLLGTRLTNRVGGVAGALVLLVHPLHVSTASIAGSDSLLVLLLALAALAAVRLAERPSWGRALLLGVLLGLGGAAKLSPLLLALPLAALGAWLLLDAWRHRSSSGGNWRRDRLVWQLLAIAPIAFATFVAVYPYLWRAPLEHTRDLFAFRALSMELQSGIWANVSVDSRAEALQRVGTKLGADFSASGWAAARIGERLGLEWRGQARGLDLVLALAGGVVLVGLAVRNGARGGHALASVVLGGAVAITVLGMRADFPRYHLPIVLAAAVGIGVLAGCGWTLVPHGRAPQLAASVTR